MKNVRQLVEGKGRGIISVAPGDSVLDALKLMAQHDVGAVLVVEGATLIGIFSERDYARKIILHGKASKDTPVREIMTEKVFYVSPGQTVEESMALMTEKHIRHLPVLDSDKKVIGIVSIGDLVKEIISEQESIIRHLEAYIAG